MNFRFTVVALTLIVLFACKPEQKENTLYKTGDSLIDQLSVQIAQDDQNALLFFKRGAEFFQKELFDEAIADLNVAIGIDSLVPAYHHLLSDAYMDYFKSKQALLTMENAAMIFPDSIYTLLKLSETQLILKKYEDMNITLRRVISKDPQNAEAYFMMGMMFRSNDDLEKAKNAFQAAIEIDPELIDAWLIMGNIFEQEGNPLALQYYKSATQADTTNIQAFHSMAYYLQNNNQIDEALTVYRTINRINRNYPDAYLNAGILLLEKSDYEAAFEQFNILITVSPQNYLAYYYRGITHELKGDLVNARNDYQTSINFNNDFDKAKEALNAIANK